MAKKMETTWPIEPHTEAKHEILRRYWDAWLPIMTRSGRRVLYIDGFAGPGRYESGEDGSPLIVIKSARDHVARPNSEVVFAFIERDRARFDSLKGVLAEILPGLPENFKVFAKCGAFDDEMTDLFDYLDKQGSRMAPSLVFVDPFGFSHTPFRTIERIMNTPHCEVIVTFMYEEINRFLNYPDHTQTYDELFGTREWRKALGVADPVIRRRLIHDVYRDQLRRVGKHVRSFEMINKRNRTDYFLFFCTNELLGLEKMKDSMWKIDRSGEYQFSDFTEGTGTMPLFEEGPNFEELKKLIVAKFKGSTVDVEQIGDFVVAETPFRRTHFKTHILKPMEQHAEIIIDSPGANRRRGTFPSGTRVRFA